MDSACPPDVSVIIAAYNVRSYIERAVRSALTQEQVNVEVIVVDDMSTDDTIKVCEGINDPRLRLLRSNVNGGPGAARNKGIHAARGKWVAILDADDCFGPARLKTCINNADKNNASIVVDNIKIAGRHGDPQDMFRRREFVRMKFLDLSYFIKRNSSFLGGSSLGYVKPIILREFLEAHNLKYPIDIRIGEDYQFLADALACGARCVVEPSSGYIYTRRDNSISYRMTVQHLKAIQKADENFKNSFSLSERALRSLRARSDNINDAIRFSALVDAIKTNSYRSIIRILIVHPTVLLRLNRPLIDRLRRILKC